MQERIDAELLHRQDASARHFDQIPDPPAKKRRGAMNKTETAYLALLESRGDVLEARFEEVKFRLATGAWYTPDFFARTKRGFEVHEVKGFWREAARVRIKVAAEQFPWWPFYVAKKVKVADGGGWDIELVSCRGRGE